MNQNLARKRVALLSIFGLVVSLMFMLTAQSASAITWPQPIADTYPHQVYTHGDGSVTLAECASQSYTNKTVRTLNPAGDVTNNVAKSTASDQWQTSGCEGKAAAAKDGTFYAQRYKYTAGYQDIELAAYKNNVVLWSAAVQICSSGSLTGDPRWVTVGTDGDIYAVMAGQCASPDKLVGFSASDGSIKFSISLNNDVYNQPYYWPLLNVYSGGLTMLDGTTLRYFNYDGSTAGAPADYAFSLAGGESVVATAVGSSGRMYVAISGTTGCSAKTDRIAYHDPSGTSGSTNVLNECVSTSVLRAMPDGGILIQEQGEYPRILRYSSTGVLVYSTALWSVSGYGNVWVAWPQVDAKGNVVIVRSAQEGGSDYDRHTFVSTVSFTGALTPVFDTTAFDTPDTTEVFRYTSGERFGMASGIFYLPICKDTCSIANPVKLYKISITGLTMDYPRSDALSAQTVELNYVALGDSFSSGEGVPGTLGFIDGTDTSTDQCHRSRDAYPMLLDRDSSLNLNLQSFRACSGATTQSMIQGMNTENGQLDSLSQDTEVVTLTIGGNDVDFGNFVAACLVPGTGGCAEGTQVYDSTMYAIDNLLPSLLADAYGAIQTELDGNYDVKVYVVGYPYVVRGHAAQCELTIGTDEQQAAEAITVALNQAIADAVVTLGDQNNRFTYIDPLLSTSPFEGHDWCGMSPYFNGYEPLSYPSQPEVYIGHPNSEGQNAYERLIATVIS
ncbi:SGNH/GDSL hydrolase family protein [Pedobacter sp.]|nr:SGNH/GDSL hydrolase family protein [Candidatus Saccharibacteria bacterium]